MGVHTGEASRAGTEYVGLDVHRAARIAAAAHGGQVLLSESTRQLAAGGLPTESIWRTRASTVSRTSTVRSTCTSS